MYSGAKVRKISLIVVIVEPLHGMVDDLHGVFGSLLGEVIIEHGGLQAAVAHVSLNNFRMDSGLEKVGCIAMAKRMNSNSAFVDTRLMPCLAEGPLETVNGHGVLGA